MTTESSSAIGYDAVADSLEATSNMTDSVRMASSLDKTQTKLEEKTRDVAEIYKSLKSLEPYEVTATIANYADKVLNNAGVVSVVDGNVIGAECLGISLMPKDYLQSRIQGCENFFNDVIVKTGQISKNIALAFKDALIYLKESHDSLNSRLDLLEKDVEGAPSFDRGTENIALGYRLYNLFQINKDIKEDWVTQLGKVGNTVNGISTNYYVNSKNNLNQSMAFFSGFGKMTDDETKATERYLMLPISIPSVRFKECNLPDKNHKETTIAFMKSVDLMGGRYFQDSRRINPNRKPGTVEETNTYVEGYLADDRTWFNDKPEREFNDLNQTVKSLSKDEIKAVIKQLRTILKAWDKVYVDGDKFELSTKDFDDVGKMLWSAEWDVSFKNSVIGAFSTIIRKNQQELLDIRNKVNTYLVLLVNATIELCYSSLKVNLP